MNDKILSLLGMARRAGRLSCGHDAATEAIVKDKAKLCLCCVDASQRLKNEMAHSCNFGEKNIRFIETGYNTEALSKAIGSKAAVVTVNDEGFANKIGSLLRENTETGKE